MTGPPISVVIVTYNSGYVLAGALNSIAAHLPGVAVIIVDNGSVDDTLEIAERGEHITVVQGHGNVGFGTGVNLAVAASKTRLVLVMNPDTTIANIEMSALVELSKRRPLGLVACAISVGGTMEEPLKAAWGWRRELLWNLWTFYLKPRRVGIRRPAAKPGQPAWIGGAAFLAATDEWAATGGFDEEVFLYYEDFDLSRRYRVAGFPLLETDAVAVAHSRQEEKRGVGVDLVASWVFRSLIQLTISTAGARAGKQAAGSTLLALRLVELTGRFARWMPRVGHVGFRKAESAARVRRYLIEEPARAGAADHYAQANAVLADLARRRAMDL